jgi:Zn-dependent metalloprotease
MRQFRNPDSQHSGEPHIASGIVSVPMAAVQRRLGWDKTARVTYAVMQDDRLDNASTFAEFAKLATEHASRLYGSDAANTVRTEFRRVGLQVPGRRAVAA